MKDLNNKETNGDLTNISWDQVKQIFFAKTKIERSTLILKNHFNSKKTTSATSSSLTTLPLATKQSTLQFAPQDDSKSDNEDASELMPNTANIPIILPSS